MVLPGRISGVQELLSLHRVSAQQSDASFSSQQRPRETAEASAEPEAERETPPQTFKEKVLDKLRGMSIMPSPDRALETCQEDTGAVLWQAAHSSLSLCVLGAPARLVMRLELRADKKLLL